MRIKAKTLVVTSVVLVLAGTLLSFVHANHREIRVLSVTVGSHRFAVDNSLGKAQPDHSRDPKEEWLVYEGNPSLWFGRLEDHVSICYSNDVVVAIERIGL